MEVSYRRKLHKSYMCIKSQEPVLREYELQMLKGQDIPGLLPMECMFVDGVQNYFYEISGKQQKGFFWQYKGCAVPCPNICCVKKGYA